jgi:hypothetical protein
MIVFDLDSPKAGGLDDLDHHLFVNIGIFHRFFLSQSKKFGKLFPRRLAASRFSSLSGALMCDSK